MNDVPGNIVTEFKPHPRIEDEELDKVHAYWSSVKNMRMIRDDGKNIIFDHWYFEGNQSGDIEYLEKEISKGHLHIRRATHEEIRAAHYRMNPRNAALEDVKSDDKLMAELKREVELKLMKELGLTPEQLEQIKQENAQFKDNPGSQPDSSDALKLQSVDSQGSGVKTIKTPTATVTIPQLRPQSTADLGGAGQNSNSGTT